MTLHLFYKFLFFNFNSHFPRFYIFEAYDYNNILQLCLYLYLLHIFFATIQAEKLSGSNLYSVIM